MRQNSIFCCVYGDREVEVSILYAFSSACTAVHSSLGTVKYKHLPSLYRKIETLIHKSYVRISWGSKLINCVHKPEYTGRRDAGSHADVARTIKQPNSFLVFGPKAVQHV